MPDSRTAATRTDAGFGHVPAMTDGGAVFLIAVCWLALVALVDPRGDFPLNDDWVYALAVKSVLETGFLQFPSPASANVGPQVYWGALFCLPFGFSFTALRISTLVLGLIGALALFDLVRSAGAGRGTASFCALLLACNPLYFSLSNSFMTDVPFLAVMLVASSLLLRGLRSDSAVLLASGLALTFLLILIRQLGIALLLGFVAANWVKHGVTWRRGVLGILLVLTGLALHLGYQFWLANTGRVPAMLSHASMAVFSPSIQDLKRKAQTLLVISTYTGLFLAPLVAALWFRQRSAGAARRWTPVATVGVVATGAVFIAFVLFHKMMPTGHNVLIPSGIGPLLLHDTFVREVNSPVVPLVARLLWAGATLLAIAAALTVIALLVKPTRDAFRSFRSKSPVRPWLGVYCSVTAVSYLLLLVLIAGRTPIFDRYFLLFLPFLMLVLCSVYPRVLSASSWLGRSCCALLLAVMMVFSVAGTHDFLAWNRQRWAALHDLMAGGVSPRQIDGGYEFNGWYLWSLHLPVYTGSRVKSWWWVVDNEYVIASADLPGYVRVARYPFERWLFGVESQIVTLQRQSPSASGMLPRGLDADADAGHQPAATLR